MTWLFALPLLFALPMFFFSLAFIIGCFEKLPVRSFEACEPGTAHPYIISWTQQALLLGYLYRADGCHIKYKEKLRSVLFISPDYSTLAIVSAGTIFGLPLQKTILISRPKEGGFLFTVDDPGTCELDKMTRRQILGKKASLALMTAEHRLVLESTGGAETFSQDSSWSTVDEIYRERTDRIVVDGYGKYLGDSKEPYAKTIAGSFRASIVHGILQLFRPQNHRLWEASGY